MSTLSKQEILFFKEEGYLVKRDVLDPELMAYARERLWEAAPSQLKRDRLALAHLKKGVKIKCRIDPDTGGIIVNLVVNPG